MGIMKVMGPTDGDKHIEWDPEDPKSVEKARKEFEELRKKGHKAFKVGRKPQRTGQEVAEFDPSAGEIILTPPMAGG